MEHSKEEGLEERYLDIREAAEILEISEAELWGLVHKNEIPHHNLAGAFLRFRKNDVDALKIRWRIQRDLFPAKEPAAAHAHAVSRAGFGEAVRDFWYFNDYYVLCFVLMVLLLYLIISSQ